MGKIRVKTFGDEEQEQEELKKAQQKKEAKKAAKQAAAVVVPEESKETKEEPKEEKKAAPKKKEKFQKETKPKRSKKYQTVAVLVDRNKIYTLSEALELLPKLQLGKFDETVEVCFKLGVDPKHAEQMIRGAVVLPHGVGKAARVAVIAKGDKAKEAEKAGADIVGSDDLVEKILGGWLEFDSVADYEKVLEWHRTGVLDGFHRLQANAH